MRKVEVEETITKTITVISEVSEIKVGDYIEHIRDKDETFGKVVYMDDRGFVVRWYSNDSQLVKLRVHRNDYFEDYLIRKVKGDEVMLEML